MSFNAEKTILLEKQYLYIRASKGFELEGVSTERIWTNTGYYRFLVDNVAKTLGNSYVTVHYDSSDIDFIAYCSDLFMEELQNSIVVAVENIQDYLQQFAAQNHEDIENLGEGVSGAMEVLHLDNENSLRSISSLVTGLSSILSSVDGLKNKYDWTKVFAYWLYDSTIKKIFSANATYMVSATYEGMPKTILRVIVYDTSYTLTLTQGASAPYVVEISDCFDNHEIFKVPSNENLVLSFSHVGMYELKFGV